MQDKKSEPVISSKQPAIRALNTRRRRNGVYISKPKRNLGSAYVFIKVKLLK
jgi:hypothetical protein